MHSILNEELYMYLRLLHSLGIISTYVRTSIRVLAIVATTANIYVHVSIYHFIRSDKLTISCLGQRRHGKY